MTEREINSLPRRIISGGQTGVDRGALDAAIALELEHGGWCPRGRLAEDGQIPKTYQLQETDSPDYPVRTEKNVVDSDGTLIFYRNRLQGGTELTARLVKRHEKPHLLVDIESGLSLADIRQWIQENNVEVLNIAGPRESSAPGIAMQTRQLLRRLLD